MFSMCIEGMFNLRYFQLTMDLSGHNPTISRRGSVLQQLLLTMQVPSFHSHFLYYCPVFNTICTLYLHKILLLFCGKFLFRIIHIFTVLVAFQFFWYFHASIWDHQMEEPLSFSLKNFLFLLVFWSKFSLLFFSKMSFGCRLTVIFFINLKINQFIVFWFLLFLLKSQLSVL